MADIELSGVRVFKRVDCFRIIESRERDMREARLGHR
jgi:hypothetical protein